MQILFKYYLNVEAEEREKVKIPWKDVEKRLLKRKFVFKSYQQMSLYKDLLYLLQSEHYSLLLEYSYKGKLELFLIIRGSQGFQ